MKEQGDFTLEAIQSASHFLDREASCDKACRLIAEAADKDIEFIKKILSEQNDLESHPKSWVLPGRDLSLNNLSATCELDRRSVSSGQPMPVPSLIFCLRGAGSVKNLK